MSTKLEKQVNEVAHFATMFRTKILVACDSAEFKAEWDALLSGSHRAANFVRVLEDIGQFPTKIFPNE